MNVAYSYTQPQTIWNGIRIVLVSMCLLRYVSVFLCSFFETIGFASRVNVIGYRCHTIYLEAVARIQLKGSTLIKKNKKEEK